MARYRHEYRNEMRQALQILILIEFARLAAFHSGIRRYSAPFTGSVSAYTIVPNILLVQEFFPLSWNGPSWSIGCEFFAYLTFVFVSLAAANRPTLVIALSATLIIRSGAV